jgi:hypothetical protein
MAFFSGQGAALARGATTPVPTGVGAHTAETYGTVALVSGMKPPGNKKVTNTFKTLDSADPRVISGGFEDRQVTLRLVFDPAETQHVGILADSKASSAASKRWWRMVLPDAGNYTFHFIGEVIDFEWEDLENEKEVAASVTIAIDGNVIETP